MMSFPAVLKYAIDDSGEAYADGVLISTTSGHDTVTTAELSSFTRLITFKTINNKYGVTGVRAWLSNGVITNASSGWRCSLVLETGWTELGFNDTHWNSVNVVSSGGGHVGYRSVTVGCDTMASGAIIYIRKLLTS